MYMEFATGVEGSTAYLCYFNKKRLIKILHSWGINDFRGFLKNYIWDDTDAMMCEFEDRGWSYKKETIPFQERKIISGGRAYVSTRQKEIIHHPDWFLGRCRR